MQQEFLNYTYLDKFGSGVGWWAGPKQFKVSKSRQKTAQNNGTNCEIISNKTEGHCLQLYKSF